MSFNIFAKSLSIKKLYKPDPTISVEGKASLNCVHKNSAFGLSTGPFDQQFVMISTSFLQNAEENEGMLGLQLF